PVNPNRGRRRCQRRCTLGSHSGRGIPWTRSDVPGRGRCRGRIGCGGLADLVEPGDRAAQVRDDDRAADDEADGEGLEELLVGDALLGAADEVVGDAIVAAEYEGGDEAEELLGTGGERAVLVGA